MITHSPPDPLWIHLFQHREKVHEIRLPDLHHDHTQGGSKSGSTDVYRIIRFAGSPTVCHELMHLLVKGITGEYVGVEYLAKGPPLGVDREPDDRVVGVVMGGECIRDVTSGENEVLFFEDLFGGGR
ncbi:hypothetical protein L6452_44358 [Arctium lappa]|uniref:Uncharacterized protein n=1 Tax=Arctium lappa TaxID=4217 RepID=A0ACB8XFE9_ARCLA|nr:hypothetical protein L6452_44358 [Arctium lappa]